MLGVEFGDLAEGEVLCPGSVVEDLGDDLPRCPVPLQLDDVNPAFDVDAQHVDVTAVLRRDLATDDEDGQVDK